MDPKLAKILAEHAVPREKKASEEIAANDPSHDASAANTAEEIPVLFAQMYPLLTKKLRKRRGGGMAQR